MSKDIHKAFKKTSLGNYFGYYKGFYIYTYRKPHGKWACNIGKGGRWIESEGHFGTSLPTIQLCKTWAMHRVKLINT